MKSSIFTGIIIVLIGITILLGVSMHGYFMPPATGILFICAGFLWVIYSIIHRKKLDAGIEKLKDKEETFLICANCRKPFDVAPTNGYRCPDCDGKLESLNGFYDRHPELNEENREETKRGKSI